MENIESPWCSWCRLCAKENAENNVDVCSIDEQPLSSDKNVKLTLNEALNRFFWVQLSPENTLPSRLCSDCYALLSSLMFFNEHVQRVQEMYKFLVEKPSSDLLDLKSVRLKFEVRDFPKITRQSSAENIQNSGETCTERVTVDIKQEEWSIDSIISEYEDVSNEDNKSVYREEELFDEEIILKDVQEKVEDSFDVMSDGSSWGEEEDKTDPEGTEKKQISDANDVKISQQKEHVATDSQEEEDPFEDMAEDSLLIEYKVNVERKSTIEDFALDITCKECGKVFYLYSTYCEHMEMSHGSASGIDKDCPICNRTLQTFYHLGRHMRYHMPLEARYPIKCPECDSRFGTSAQLKVHIDHKHRNTKPFICEVCGFRGGTKNSLTQHMYIHTDNAPFECEVCKKKFKKRSRLNFHMDIHGPNKFVCSVCGLQLNSRATLKNHLAVHSDEMHHKCDYCGKSFKRSKYLKSHLLLHTGLKPYQCNFCDRTFSNRTTCRSHMRKSHPNEVAALDASGNKQYTKNVPRLEALKEVCKATTADSLRPLGRYSGRIVCDFCDRRFSMWQSCKAHMKQKHPEEYVSFLASGNRTRRKPKPKTVIEWFDYGKSETCDFCGRTYHNRKYCRAHMKSAHLEQLTPGCKTHAVAIPKLEGNETEIENEDEAVTPDEGTTLETAEKSGSASDLTHNSTTTTVTNIQDFFLLID